MKPSDKAAELELKLANFDPVEINKLYIEKRNKEIERNKAKPFGVIK